MTGQSLSTAVIVSPLRDAWARVAVALDLLGAAVEAADWEGAAEGNRQLQASLERFDVVLIEHRDALSADHVLSLIAALREVFERHAGHMVALEAARNELAKDLSATRGGHAAAHRYLEAADA